MKSSVVKIYIPLNADNNSPRAKDQIFLNQLFQSEEELQGTYMSFLKDLSVRAGLGQCDRRHWLKFRLHRAQEAV